jgi:hypothetical protein
LAIAKGHHKEHYQSKSTTETARGSYHLLDLTVLQRRRYVGFGILTAAVGVVAPLVIGFLPTTTTRATSVAGSLTDNVVIIIIEEPNEEGII